MDVVQGVANVQRYTYGPPAGYLPKLIQNRAQGSSLYPLRDKVELAALRITQNADHAGVMKLFSDFLFLAKTLANGGIVGKFEMRELNRDLRPSAQIRASKYRR